MKNSLGKDLEEALTLLSPVMINKDWIVDLRKTAFKLPPVIRIILECRLSANQPQVDLSQSFLAEDRAVLHSFFDPARIKSKNWNNINSLIRQWSVPDSPVERNLKGIWLEFDLLPGLEEELAVPAIFLSMNDNSFSSLSDQKLEKTLEYFFQLVLGTDQYQPFFSAYLACINRLPDGATPNYLGFMLSREPVTVRAQFAGIHKGQLEHFLTDIDFNYLPESLQNTMDIAYRFFYSNVLCIDLSPAISPRIGLELFPKQYIQESLFVEFLDVLVSKGFCSEQKREAIESWPGRRDPANCGADWPDYLILQSLQKSADCFSVMNRRINHFKLVCQPDHDIEAKAYLAFDHWAQFDNS